MARSNKEAKLAVAQVYWNRCRLFKEAESMKDKVRDLALTAIRKGETVGPVSDVIDGTDHWLTHGEKEHVEMDALELYRASGLRLGITTVLCLCNVNTAALKHEYPKIYELMMKHRSTKRTKHSCLTWSEKTPKRKAKR